MIDVSEILPHLFLGTFPKSTEDIDRLHRRGVTAVLNGRPTTTWPTGASTGIVWNSTTVKRASRFAGFQCEISITMTCRQLPGCVEVLNELLSQGHIVYVHCNMGVNRSPSIVIAYLHWIAGWSLEKATDHVMKCRSCDPYLDAIQLASEDRRRKE